MSDLDLLREAEVRLRIDPWRAADPLADWLAGHARDLEMAAGRPGACDSPGDVQHAVAVARAYLRHPKEET